MATTKKPLQEKFWNRVNKTPGLGPNGSCWEWIGALESNGYGRLSVDGKKDFVHRLAYKLTKGEIPFYTVIRHKCDNRRCVNPDHLEAGTQKDNMLDMVARGRHNNGNTGLSHCQRGHEFSAENTRIASNGQRLCRECLRLKSRQRKASARAVKVANGTFRKHANPKTHCKHGHPLTPDNTYTIASGARLCRQCALDRYRAKAGDKPVRPIKAKSHSQSPAHREGIKAAQKNIWKTRKSPDTD